MFISSTMKDLQEERMALAKAINENRFGEAVYAEAFVARTESPREICLEEVRKSHIYIGIFKSRYGYIPKDNPQGLSVVALEYNEARNVQIPIFIFICKNVSYREPRLEEFLKGITDFDKGHWVKEYSTINELVRFTLEAINSELIREYVKAIDAKRKEQIMNIYNLPYFERVMKKLKND